jgi:hypothetical protein
MLQAIRELFGFCPHFAYPNLQKRGLRKWTIAFTAGHYLQWNQTQKT